MSAEFPVTLFRDLQAQSLTQCVITLRELGALIANTAAPTKGALPLLKLATFGKKRTAENCLRHDANMLMVFGVEGDYDGEQTSLDEAAARIRAAGIEALLYTSPSHRPEAPRWRVLTPFADAMPLLSRAGMVSRIDVVLGGLLNRESWTLSQAFYFGRINNDFRIDLIEGDRIDTRHDLYVAETPRRKIDIIGTPAICTELSAYGEAALRSAAEKIIAAPNKQQELTLNAEAFAIGGLAGAGGVPADLALDILLIAARKMSDHDSADSWHVVPPGKVDTIAESKVKRAFAQGVSRPRPSLDDVMRETHCWMGEAVEIDWKPVDG